MVQEVVSSNPAWNDMERKKKKNLWKILEICDFQKVDRWNNTNVQQKAFIGKWVVWMNDHLITCCA